MEPNKTRIKEYADGWITEREGTAIPGFLKLAYCVIAGGALAYFFVYMYGEVNHPDRGALVRAMNAATEASGEFDVRDRGDDRHFRSDRGGVLVRQTARLRNSRCRTVSTKSGCRMRRITGSKWSSAGMRARCIPTRADM